MTGPTTMSNIEDGLEQIAGEIPADSQKYKIQTTVDEKSGTITTTLWFEDPQGAFGKKLHQVSHQVLATKDRDIAKGLRKLGWVSPTQYVALLTKLSEMLDGEQQEELTAWLEKHVRK